MNERQSLEQFRSALRSPDPNALAKVLKIPPLSANKQRNPPSKSSARLEEDGKDWSGVVSAWMDATQYALTVSSSLFISLDIGDDRQRLNVSFVHAGLRHGELR